MSGFKAIEFKKDEYIYTDTSALLQFVGYNNNSSLKRKVAEVISAAHNANVPLVVSSVALNEISHVIVKDVFEKAGYSRQEDIKWLQRTHPAEYKKLLNQALETYRNYKRKILQNEAVLDNVIFPSEEAWEKKEVLMDTYGIFGSTDALHLAIALDYGLDYFLTTDSDFQNLAIPDIKMICVDENNIR